MNSSKIEALYSILDFIKRGSEDYVVITNSNIAANIDFDDVFAAHIAKGADAQEYLKKRAERVEAG